MPRCAGPRPAFSLLFGRMRSRVAIAILAALGAGCASMRGVTLDRPKAAAVTPISPPAAAPPELHTITNPRIDVWERRLRTQPTLREATEDSLGRGATYLPRLCAILGEHGLPPDLALLPVVEDRKSTRLNSSHDQISYAVFCLKKKKIQLKDC